MDKVIWEMLFEPRMDWYPNTRTIQIPTLLTIYVMGNISFVMLQTTRLANYNETAIVFNFMKLCVHES